MSTFTDIARHYLYMTEIYNIQCYSSSISTQPLRGIQL